MAGLLLRQANQFASQMSTTGKPHKPNTPFTDVPAWLEGIGLPQYIEVFKQNDISERVVLEALTDYDLQSLGIEHDDRQQVYIFHLLK